MLKVMHVYYCGGVCVNYRTDLRLVQLLQTDLRPLLQEKFLDHWYYEMPANSRFVTSRMLTCTRCKQSSNDSCGLC